MSWLTAAAAFVVAMILLSTITSTVAECLHRLCHMRERGLRLMLEQLFAQFVWPRLALRANATKDELEKERAEACRRFVATLLRNRAVGDRGRFGWLGHWLAPARIASLAPQEFAERLAETDAGRAFAARVGAAADAAVEDLTRRFERIGADASAYFHQRAKTLSLLIALAIAFALNVDAIRLFTVFATDRALAERLAAQGATLVDAGAPAPAGSPVEADPAAEATAALGDARRQVAAVMASGLPIGSRYFPWCEGGGDGEACAALMRELTRDEASRAAYAAGPITATLATVTTLPLLWMRWLLFTVLSGLLIGLGSPFWFDAFTKLSGMVQMGRVLGLRTRYDAATGAAREASVQPAPAPPPTPAAAFRAALPTPSTRLVLAPGGAPLRRR